MFKELGFKTPKEFLAYRIIVNDIKSIAENAKNVINTAITFREIYSQILDFNSMAHKLFEESLRAAFKWDYKQADKLFPQIESLEELERELATIIYTKKLDPNVSSIFWLVLESSKKILEYSKDIAEVTLNKTVEEICLAQHS